MTDDRANDVRPFCLEELLEVARTIYGEARGETRPGQLGVTWVIRNRVYDRRWPNAWGRVCKQRKQFSCWNRGEVNNWPMLVADLSDEAFRRCFAIASAVMVADPRNLDAADPTGGANHYHAAGIALPRWADPAKETASLGRHLFYRL